VGGVVAMLSFLGLAGAASAKTNLYGVQPSTGNIVRVDPSSGNVLSSFAAPDALAAGNTSVGLSGAEEGASLIYINSNIDTSRIYRLDPTTGAVLSQHTASNSTGGLSFQTGAAGEKFIYLLDGEFDIHRQTGFGGGQSFFWGPDSPGPRQAAGGDDQGREFAFYTDNQIREYDPFTDNDTALRTFSPPATDVRGLAFDGSNLYVSTASGALYTLDPDTGAVRTTATVSSGALFGLGVILSVPDAPVDLSTTPASPANDNAPRITGTAEPGSTVEVFTTDDCSGTPVATGTAADFATPGLTATVPDNSTTTFYATATDAEGTSECSTSNVTYREDSTRPPQPQPQPQPQPADTTRPRARVAGVRAAGCVRRAFSVRVTTRDTGGIHLVRVTRGARVLTTRRFADRTSVSFTVRIRVRGLRAGRHQMAMVVFDDAGNGRTVRRTFRVCARRQPEPRFTG